MPARGAIGVAWGRAMAALAASLPQRDYGDLDVVQLSGCSLRGGDHSPEGCTLAIATKLGARRHQFHAPAFVSTKSLRDALIAEPSIARHFERARACDVALFGVGELTAETTWSENDVLIADAAGAYRAAGAVGVLLARFVASNGEEIAGPLDGRQIGLALEDLLATPVRLCVAGGPEKLAAIRAVLKGSYATHLVTDADTARLLVRDAATEETTTEETTGKGEAP